MSLRFLTDIYENIYLGIIIFTIDIISVIPINREVMSVCDVNKYSAIYNDIKKLQLYVEILY